MVAVVGVMPIGATSSPRSALTKVDLPRVELAHHRDEQRAIEHLDEAAGLGAELGQLARAREVAVRARQQRVEIARRSASRSAR